MRRQKGKLHLRPAIPPPLLALNLSDPLLIEIIASVLSKERRVADRVLKHDLVLTGDESLVDGAALIDPVAELLAAPVQRQTDGGGGGCRGGQGGPRRSSNLLAAQARRHSDLSGGFRGRRRAGLLRQPDLLSRPLRTL